MKCDLCGKEIEGEGIKTHLVEDDGLVYLATVCEECAYMIEDEQYIL